MKCNYGCGKEAIYQLKNGKWCCDKFFTKCEGVRKKNIKGLKIAHDTGKYDNVNYVSWNKGLSKETDERVRKSRNTYVNNYKQGKIEIWSKGKTKYNDSKVAKLSTNISKTVFNKIKEGTWHNSFSRARTHEYNGMKFYGKWELKYAKYLDDNKINWIQNKEKFCYFFNGKNRTYTPDFYLIDDDCYIEIKGYKTEKDVAKWKQFPEHKKLKVLMGEELLKMGIIDKYRIIKSNLDNI